jgi:hypothetical protein
LVTVKNFPRPPPDLKDLAPFRCDKLISLIFCHRVHSEWLNVFQVQHARGLGADAAGQISIVDQGFPVGGMISFSFASQPFGFCSSVKHFARTLSAMKTAVDEGDGRILAFRLGLLLDAKTRKKVPSGNLDPTLQYLHATGAPI